VKPTFQVRFSSLANTTNVTANTFIIMHAVLMNELLRGLPIAVPSKQV